MAGSRQVEPLPELRLPRYMSIHHGPDMGWLDNLILSLPRVQMEVDSTMGTRGSTNRPVGPSDLTIPTISPSSRF